MVGGWGDIDGRQTVVCADDFTSRGGHADGAIATKSTYLDRLSIELRIPVRLLDGSSGGGSVAAMVPQQTASGKGSAKESSGEQVDGPRVAGSGGSFLPGHLGSNLYTKQLSTVPAVNMLLGSVVGIGAAKAVLGHFSVMVRDVSQLFVAGPPVVSHAMGYDISKEIPAVGTSTVQMAASTTSLNRKRKPILMTRRFLAFLPASVYESPPVISKR